jgi:hypothetical protein
MLSLGRRLKFSILDPRKYDLEISRFDRRVTILDLGAPRMFADSLGTVVKFDDPTFVTFNESVVDHLDSEVPVWQLGRDTVEQLGGV